ARLRHRGRGAGPRRRRRREHRRLPRDGAHRPAPGGGAGAAMTDLVHQIGLARSGAVLGLVLALGVVLILRGLPRHRRATLEERMAPYLRDRPLPSRLLAREARPLTAIIPAVLRPVIRDIGVRVERVLGGTSSVRRRLVRAGKEPDTDQFRAEQVLLGLGGGVIGGLLGLVLVTGQGRSPVFLLVLTALGFGI